MTADKSKSQAYILGTFQIAEIMKSNVPGRGFLLRIKELTTQYCEPL